jgi:monothiol glutaredoxin
MDDPVLKEIGEIVQTHPVVLFMKGTPDFPQCGFSARAVNLLKKIGVPFYAVNVLERPEIREGVKRFGNWPTLPQLYVRGELVGGSDIMMDLHERGELKPLLMEAIQGSRKEHSPSGAEGESSPR